VGAKEKRPKNSTINPLPGGGGATEKRPKNSKKRPKIALLSLYLLYLYHVWKFRRPRPLPPAADAHGYSV